MTQTKVDTIHFTISRGESPLVATAIHSGHEVRHNIKDLFHLTPEERLREEDPFTDEWVTITDSQIVGHSSRFELDLNRPPEKRSIAHLKMPGLKCMKRGSSCRAGKGVDGPGIEGV